MYEELETNLYVVGITGIEDKLQEGVEQTIATLREAGIRVWMLTGDKQQVWYGMGLQHVIKCGYVCFTWMCLCSNARMM